MTTMRPSLLWTGLAAIVIGIVIGIWLVPSWQASARMNAIASAHFETRADAWNWWRSASENSAVPRAKDQLNDLNAALANAPADAFLHGAEELMLMDLWGWETQPAPIMEHHLELLTWRAHVVDVDDAIALIESAPTNLDLIQLLPAATTLMAHPDEQVAHQAFIASVSWAGFSRRLEPVLNALPESRSGWADPYRIWATSGPISISVEPNAFPSMEGVQKDPAVSHADVVVYRVLLLEDAMSQKPESVSLIPMIDDPLDGQRELAALMAALRGTDDTTVAQAMLIEQHPQTRTSMRLALDALGRPWSDDDPSEFAWRALRQENDRLWHPPILTRLVAGDPSLLEPLLKSAASKDPIDRAVSWTLLRRFVPGWIEQDQSSEVDVLPADVFYQQLLARWYLQRRFLEQNRSGHYVTPTGL